jgi:hypothetical protein
MGSSAEMAVVAICFKIFGKGNLRPSLNALLTTQPHSKMCVETFCAENVILEFENLSKTIALQTKREIFFIKLIHTIKCSSD